MTKALLVDDSRTVRLMMGKILRTLGIRTEEAADGREALDYLERNDDVAIAFVDWNMPVMNGLQLVNALREQDRFSSLRIVMVTTETEMPKVVTALEAGVDEYIMKPFTFEIVQEKLGLLGVEESK